MYSFRSIKTIQLIDKSLLVIEVYVEIIINYFHFLQGILSSNVLRNNNLHIIESSKQFLQMFLSLKFLFITTTHYLSHNIACISRMKSSQDS